MTFLQIDKIYPNPNQPRKHFDEVKLEELAQSIKESGLMEPLIVVKRGTEDLYMIIAGERRWRASRVAGMNEVPVIVKEADDQTVAELSLLENLQREDLSIIEEALAYQGLLNMGLSQEDIARKMGIKQPWRIQERLNLLKLLPVYQDYALKGILSPSQAQELSRLPRDKQDIVFDKIVSGKLNSYNKLRAHINAMLYVYEQSSFIPEPTKKEEEVKTKYDQLIEKLVYFLNRSFNRDDLSILAKVLDSTAETNIERIDMIIWHLNKIKRALIQADSTREVMTQPKMFA
ncbi:MAG: ParB/RepB/Spo0J family partition protein [Deltaproteobacteria bacterium]|nr:ParB/RepB/Spo0J family partition protein [Deltaproteobacteria bacterium]